MVRQVKVRWCKMMRWAIYLTLILTGLLRRCLSDREEAFECPDQFGYYADTKDCSKYFVCVHGDPLHESCTGGLYFSAELQTCDWPRNVKCAAGEIPQGIRLLSTKNNQISSQNNVCRTDTKQKSTTVITVLTTVSPVPNTSRMPQLDHKERSVSDDPLYNKKPFQGRADHYPPWLLEYEDSVLVGFDSGGGVPYEDTSRFSEISRRNGFEKSLDSTEKSTTVAGGNDNNHRGVLSSNNGDSERLTPIRSYGEKQLVDGINKTIASYDYTGDYEEVLNWSPSEKNQPNLYNVGSSHFEYDRPSDSENKNHDTTNESRFYSNFDTSPLPDYTKINNDNEDGSTNVLIKDATKGPAATTPSTHFSSFNVTRSYSNVYSNCDSLHCVLPDCRCGGPDIPGGLPVNRVPQMVLLTFDDAINDLNYGLYNEIFLTGRRNPNGCPILGTFFVSHEWTDYGQVQTLYSKGHEMASHSITRSYGERFSKSQWYKEIQGQREILHKYGSVKLEDIRGMRAPFLQIGGNNMFDMLYESNFSYDASMPIFDNDPPFWPYTLDYSINHDCMITPCPTKSYPGLWELGLVMWLDLRGGRCSMADACSPTPDEESVVEMLTKNFNRHYRNNRSPFGLYYHSAWFNTPHHRKGFMKFLDMVLDKQDVWFITNWQLIQWLETPTTVDELVNFEPWRCDRNEDLPPPCLQPTVCSVWYQGGLRYMKTCKPCPKEYPWLVPEEDT